MFTYKPVRFQCCITSNIQTRAIKTLEDHPIRQYFDAGAIVVPCTDNKVRFSLSALWASQSST